ncbi:MAG: flagellar filament capping protein FliD [candidate division Zixibacteria bacterium]|nr:flagellar filament capping protein FliD [candidate division Zixibacteria bacterium]
MPGTNSIDGLVSGLDTTSIVDAMIEFERRPALFMEVDQAQKTNIISTLKALQAKVFAFQSKSQQLTYKSSFEKASVAVTDESYLTATASGRVGVGSYDLRVNSVARNHQIASQGFSADELNAFGTGTIEVGVGSASAQTITIDASNNNMTAIKDAINDAKVGITASIINDGSSSNPYRLILSANETGLSNDISITSNLTGGANFNYSTASFDVPENLVMDSGSSSQISLGASAVYTGSVNKAYTFTVQGTGSQTIGTDNITIDWTDGTNSGSIVVTQADLEMDLVGVGADGLKLSFSAGELNAGDVFQVQTFASLLQESSNAEIQFGSTGGSGSPITVVSENNKFSDVIAGVVLDVKDETPTGEWVTVTTDVDVSGIKQALKGFIDAYNDINTFIDNQNKYTEETGESGVLLGDNIVQTVQSRLRSLFSTAVNTETDQFQYLSSIGIRTGSDGKLSIKDSGRLEDALRDNLDDVIALFTDSGYASTSAIELVSASTDSREGENYAVDITQAAARGYYTGADITDPGSSSLVLDSTNNRLKITINGRESEEIVLTAKSYDSSAELVNELQLRIDNDRTVGATGLTVSWMDDGGGGGHLVLTSSAYGKTSTVGISTSQDNNAAVLLGLGTGVATAGLDVEGTINGEEASGSGQYLSGNGDNETTASLKLKITLDASQVGSGTEGTITLAKGVASKMNVLLTGLTESQTGLLDSRIASYQGQVDNLADRIADFDERMVLRRKRLMLRFQRMEEVLGQLGAQGDYIASQVSSLNANWAQISSNR